MEYIEYRTSYSALLAIMLLSMIPVSILTVVGNPFDKWTNTIALIAIWLLAIMVIRFIAAEVAATICRSLRLINISSTQERKAKEIYDALRELNESRPFSFNARVLDLRAAAIKVGLCETMTGLGVILEYLKSLGIAVKKTSAGVYIWYGHEAEWDANHTWDETEYKYWDAEYRQHTIKK